MKLQKINQLCRVCDVLERQSAPSGEEWLVKNLILKIDHNYTTGSPYIYIYGRGFNEKRIDLTNISQYEIPLYYKNIAGSLQFYDGLTILMPLQYGIAQSSSNTFGEWEVASGTYRTYSYTTCNFNADTFRLYFMDYNELP